MELRIVNLKTAKLARKAGFDAGVEDYYAVNYETKETILEDSLGDFINWNSGDYNDEFIHYSAPTQELLRKWLRDKFNLHIELNYNSNLEEDYGFQVHSVYQFSVIDHANKMYGSYEEALDVALKETLEYLLNIGSDDEN